MRLPASNTSTAHVTAQILYLGDALRRTFNVAGHVNGWVAPDRFADLADQRPPHSLGHRVFTGMGYGASLTGKFARVLGTGRHCPGPSEDTTGTAWQRLQRMWACGLRRDHEAHAARLLYLQEQWLQMVYNFETVGAAGVASGAIYTTTANLAAPVGQMLGEAIGAARWAVAWSRGRRESVWVDMQCDADECGALFGFGAAMVSSAGIGVVHWAALQGSRLALAALTGAAAGAGGAVFAAWHASLLVFDPALTRPLPMAAHDIEAPLLPELPQPLPMAAHVHDIEAPLLPGLPRPVPVAAHDHDTEARLRPELPTPQP